MSSFVRNCCNILWAAFSLARQSFESVTHLTGSSTGNKPMCFLSIQTSNVTRRDEPATRNLLSVHGAALLCCLSDSVCLLHIISCSCSKAAPLCAVLMLWMHCFSLEMCEYIWRISNMIEANAWFLALLWTSLTTGVQMWVWGLTRSASSLESLRCAELWCLESRPCDMGFSPFLPATREANAAWTVISVHAVVARGTLPLLWKVFNVYKEDTVKTILFHQSETQQKKERGGVRAGWQCSAEHCAPPELEWRLLRAAFTAGSAQEAELTPFWGWHSWNGIRKHISEGLFVG